MTIVDQIIHSPRLAQYVRTFNDLLESERAKREEFYQWLPDDKKAEFINGEIIVHSPVKFEHASASQNLFTLISLHVNKHALGFVGHEKLLICLTRNDYEPDLCFWNTAKSSAFQPKQMKFPSPDLAIEVLSPTTEETDRTIKFEDYAAHGTDEYWVVDPDQRTIEQYLLNGDHYELAVKVKDGIIRSRAVKGLEMPVAAAFESAANLRAVEAIMKI